MNLHAILQFVYENRLSVSAALALMSTAFLFNSPEDISGFTRDGVYQWFRRSLFAIVNAKHSQVPPPPKQ